MNDDNHIYVYDRAVKIVGRENVERFAKDPEKFLREAGALDGIEGFNGIRSKKDGDISDLSSFFSRNKFLKASGTIEVIIVHHGIPYEDYCTWHIEDE